MARVSVGKVDDVKPGEVREVVAQGLVVAIYNVGGTLFATDGVCLHRGGPLGQGELAGNVVTCPLHGWTYDVTSGQSLVNPMAKLKTYPVSVEDGEIRLDL